MINTTKFPSELSHHDNFWSCHLSVNRKLPNDRMDVCDFIDADFCLFGRYFYSIFEMDSIHKH